VSINIKEKHHDNGALRERCYYDANGHLHREDGPAVESFRKDGRLEYYAWRQHGVLHRNGGPAVEILCRNGLPQHRTWYCHGELHREDGPAIETFRKNGTLLQRTWYCRGKKHREDGPAVEWMRKDDTVGTAACHLDGNRVAKEEHRRRVALRRLTASAAGRLGVSL